MTTENTALTLPDEQTFLAQIRAINQFQKVAKANMVPGLDFGIIPGTQKPTLLKPGAEKISKLLGLADTYDIIEQVEDWAKPFFHYVIRCTLTSISSDVVISTGLASCNSMEARYRWRDSKRKCPSCGAEAIIKGKAEYGGGWICFKKQGGCSAKFTEGEPSIESQKAGRVENDDIYSQVNTILKMARKRALVDAALSAGRLSAIFTQDLEDAVGVDVEAEPAHTETPKPAQQQPQRASREQLTEAIASASPEIRDQILNAKSYEVTAQTFQANLAALGITSSAQMCSELGVATWQVYAKTLKAKDATANPYQCAIDEIKKLRMAKEAAAAGEGAIQ